MRQTKGTPVTISVTPSHDLSKPMQISDVMGVWARDDGGSDVEHGGGQLMAVAESPIEIEQRFEVAGAAGPRHSDATRLPQLRRMTLRSLARHVYDSFRFPQTPFPIAIDSINQAIHYTEIDEIHWERTSDTLYRGLWSIEGESSSGQERSYVLRVDPDRRITYDQSSLVDGGESVGSHTSVSTGRAPFRNSPSDQAIQAKLQVLLNGAQGSLGSAQNQIS